MLDEYLQVTATGGQQQQQVHSTGVQAQTQFLHSQVLRGVHAALDSALAATTGQASPSSRCSWAAPDQQHGPAAQQSATTTASAGATTPRGIFRAMRQADASAMYAEKLAAAGADNRMQQDPVFAGTADALTSEIRLLADHAAFSTKLARLQTDMDVRSYRQGLLRTLQQPSALFNRSQPQKAVRTSVQQQSLWQGQQAAGTAPRCRSAVMWEGSAHSPVAAAAAAPAVLQRPCTAPKPSAPPAHTQTSLHASGTDRAVASGMEVDASAGFPGVLAASAPPQLLHLKHLAELELPWKPRGGDSTRHSSSSSWAGRQGNNARSPSWAASNSQRGATTQQQQQQQGDGVPRPASAVAALQQSLDELQRLKTRYTQQQQQQEQVLLQQELQRQQQEVDKQERQQQLRQMVATPGAPTWLQQHQAAQGGQHSTHTLSAAVNPLQDSSRASVWADMDTAAATTSSLLFGGGGAGPAAALRATTWRQQQHSQRQGSAAQHSYSCWDAWQQQVHADLQQQHQQGPNTHSAAARQQAGRVAAAMRRSQSAPRMRAWDAVPLDSSHIGDAFTSSRHSQQHHHQQHHFGSLHRASAGGVAGGSGGGVHGSRSRSPGGVAGGVGLGARGGLTSSWDDSLWSIHQRRQQQQQQTQQQRQSGEMTRPRTAAARFGGSSSNVDAGTPAAAAAGSSRGLGPAATAVLGCSNAVNRALAGASSSAGWLNSSPLKRTVGLAPARGSSAVAGGYRASAAASDGVHKQHGATGTSSWLPASSTIAHLRRVAASGSGQARERVAVAAIGQRQSCGQVQGIMPTQQQQQTVGPCQAAVLVGSRSAAASGGASGHKLPQVGRLGPCSSSVVLLCRVLTVGQCVVCSSNCPPVSSLD